MDERKNDLRLKHQMGCAKQAGCFNGPQRTYAYGMLAEQQLVRREYMGFVEQSTTSEQTWHASGSRSEAYASRSRTSSLTRWEDNSGILVRHTIEGNMRRSRSNKSKDLGQKVSKIEIST